MRKISVNKNKRHKAKKDYLNPARALLRQTLIITRPKNGEKKASVLGGVQSFSTFGADIVNAAKDVHKQCYDASQIYLKDERTFNKRLEHFNKAIDDCDDILRMLDFCIIEYGTTTKKRNSLFYVAKLTRTAKFEIQDRINRDKLILEDKD